MGKSTEFTSEFKKDIINKLNDYQGGIYYGCDLSSVLFEGENASGSVLCNTYATKEFICLHFDLFGDLVQHCKDEMDFVINPFLEPEKAHVILLLEAASSILSKLPTIEKNWNNKIELTPKIVKKLTKEINSLIIRDEDIF